METRTLGSLGPVSALTLGGGGIGAVWGETSRAEAVATAREAIEGGITLLDLAPSYGDGESETVIGEAFGGNLPDGVRVTTKCQLGDAPAAEIYNRLSESLTQSLQRMQLQRVDIFILHSNVVPDGAGSGLGTPLSLFREAVRPAFARIVEEGRAGAWGITGIGWPNTVRVALGDDEQPAIVQCIANLLDSGGSLRRSEEPFTPRQTIALAQQRGVGVMGIRAVQAGALTDRFDRELPETHPDMADFHRAAPVRGIAAELSVGAAHLAHRYALTVNGVDTLVLGVKNREELHDCLAAEAAGPLDPELIQRIDHAVGRDS
jgi:aryl-alcohol dehydrogenase-like predicted oxidoreductase